MRVDIRYPIGLLFAIFGAILTLYGIIGDKTIYAKSLGMDVNLWWGLILLAFGLGMLSFAIRDSQPDDRPRAAGPGSADQGKSSSPSRRG